MKFTENDREEAKWLKSQGLNWIGKDNGNSFSVTINKPIKNEKEGYWVGNEETDLILISRRKTLFSALSYEDTEPIKLDDIIGGEQNDS